MVREETTIDYHCPVEATLDVIGGKWKGVILFHLTHEGTHRFAVLHRKILGVSERMLTQQLREREEDGIVQREVYPEVPPKVEYSLTDYGKTLPSGQSLDRTHRFQRLPSDVRGTCWRETPRCKNRWQEFRTPASRGKGARHGHRSSSNWRGCGMCVRRTGSSTRGRTVRYDERELRPTRTRKLHELDCKRRSPS